MQAEVGQPHPYGHPMTFEYVPDYDDPKAGEWVVTILETRCGPYLVCTHNRGIVRGEPILVGINEPRSVVYFDGYGPTDDLVRPRTLAPALPGRTRGAPPLRLTPRASRRPRSRLARLALALGAADLTARLAKRSSRPINVDLRRHSIDRATAGSELCG